MKEQLNNITRELQEITTKELTKEEERKNDILYKKELHNFANDLIIEEFEKGLQEQQTAKEIYNNLILNDDNMKSYIIDALYSYKIIITKKMTLNNGEIYKKEFVNFPFQGKDIYHDIEQIYYNTLKNIYNKYTLKTNIKKEELKKELSETFFETFKKYGYTQGKIFLYDEIIKNSFVNKVAEDKEEAEHLKTIYLKTLKETEKNFLLMYPQPKTTRQTTTQKKYKPPFRKTILIGSFIHGTIKGLYKASK